MHTAILFKRKGAWHDSFELNYIARKIINNNPQYWKGILMVPVAYGLYFAALYFSDMMRWEVQTGTGIIIGALFVVNFIHLNNINHYHLMKNDKAYWATKRRHNKRYDKVVSA